MRGEDSYGRYLLGSYGDPHMCGEAPKFVARISCVLETPPRAWGRRRPDSCGPLRSRNTPTCVGKTISGKGNDMFYRKHPHVRGEDAGSGLSCQKTLETPPRAWGRRISPSVARSVCGNTPTCVGKTTMSIDAASKHQKHPHVRGEDDAQYEVVPEERETPPRAWGRLAFARKLGFKAGNTPTCVGKTLKTGNTPTCVGKTLRDY